MYYNFAVQFVAEQKFSNKEVFAMLFRPQLQASSEGGDRRNDNKSYTIHDPEAENCPKSRCARVQTNICCNHLDYFWPMQAAIDASTRPPPRRLPLRLRRLRILLHWFPIVADCCRGYASKKRSIPDFCNEFPNRHLCHAINAIIKKHFFNYSYNWLWNNAYNCKKNNYNCDIKQNNRVYS